MGLVKTKRLAAMRPPSPSAFAKATAGERRTWQRVKAEGIPGDLGCYVDILMAGEVDA